MTEFFIGLKAEDLRGAALQGDDAAFHQTAAIDRYAEGATRNAASLDRTSRWLAAALLLMGAGVAALAIASSALIIIGNTGGVEHA